MKRSITVLFVVAILFLANTVITPKVTASEVSVNLLLEGKGKQACQSAQYFVIGSTECTKVSSKTPDLLPTKVLETKAKPKEETKSPQSSSYTPVSYTFNQQSTATLSAEMLFALVNQHREAISLPAFTHDAAVCEVAQSRYNELSNEMFTTHALHAGFYAKNLPYYATENMIWQHTEQDALNWWLHSPVHRAALEGSYKYACGVCNGEVCNMVFTNYEQKVLAQFPSVTPSPATSTVTPLPTLVAQTPLKLAAIKR